MANKIVLVDTSVLIDYFRKTDKKNATLVNLFDVGFDLMIAAITHYEVYIGATPEQMVFWNDFLKQTKVLSFDKIAAQIAVDINRELKRKRKLIDTADLFIAATAISNKLPLATLNKNHFNRISGLEVLV